MQDINLKQIKALIALCRKSGVTSIKVAGVELNLSDLPSKAPRNSKKAKDTSPGNDSILSDGPTKEELLMWSTGVSNPIFLDEEQAV